MLKNLQVVFRRTLRVFYFFMFSFLYVFIFHAFISSCFCFFLFLFLLVFISPGIFIDDSICLLHRFFNVYVVTTSATDFIFTIRKFFTLHSFPAFIKASLGLTVLPYRLQGFPLRFENRPGPSVCLNHTVLGNNMISMELYLNLSKYVDKLLVVKSLINFKHIS